MTADASVEAFAFGAGVQSMAALVLAARREIKPPEFVFANVGEDSELPGTLRYLHEYALPFAAAHRLNIHEVRRTRRDGSTETLWQRMMRPESRSIPIPIRMGRNAPPGTRTCTVEFKIRTIGKWLRSHGATAHRPAKVGIGFSTDELERVNPTLRRDYEVASYPLIDLGLNRAACERVITEAGLPTPPKSACFFCPFSSASRFNDMRRDDPELFERTCRLEDELNRRRASLGRAPVFITLRPSAAPGVRVRADRL